MPEDFSDSVKQSIKRWLNQRGFEDNPFATSDAEKEYFLHQVFVNTGKLEWIRGDATNPHTVLFFAFRGCGKTAHRKMLEFELAPTNRNGDTLAVIYNEFDHWQELQKVPTAADHIHAILQKGIVALFDAVVRQQKWPEIWQPEHFCELKQLCLEFAIDMLQPVKILRYLKQAGIDVAGHSITLQDITVGLNETRLAGILKHKGISEEKTPAHFFIQLVDACPTTYDLALHSSRSAMELFVELTLALGMKNVYVLVDSVDEVILQNSDWLTCLEPLLSDLHLMNKTKGLAFKFFLPAEYQDEFLSRQWVRADKLPYAKLVWSEEDLKSLMRHRLRAFSSVGIDSIKGMCEPRLASVIDDELVRAARGVPRTLLDLGNMLLGVHGQKISPQQFITHEEWLQVLAMSEQTFGSVVETGPALPYLYIDSLRSCVYMGERGLKRDLTPLELRFLVCLTQHDGFSSKQQIIECVYDNPAGGVTDQAVSSVVSRLRKKIESDPADPQYLKTEHSSGFSLWHWRLVDNSVSF